LYVDENIAPQLARSFNIIQEHLNLEEKRPIEVLSIKDVFGEGALDEDWIPKVGSEGGVVLTYDRRIQTARHQKELYIQHGVGIIFLKAQKNGMTFWNTFKHLVHWWDAIKSIIRKNKTPFAFRQPGKNKRFEKWEAND
jgi:hypothetical protein